jgi:hypothetical protein
MSDTAQQEWTNADLLAAIKTVLANPHPDGSYETLGISKTTFIEDVNFAELLRQAGVKRELRKQGVFATDKFITWCTHCPFAVRFQQCEFAKTFNTKDVHFKQSLHFHYTLFTGKTSFKRAVFAGTHTAFGDTTFLGEETSFESIIFEGKTSFDRTTFSGKTVQFNAIRIKQESNKPPRTLWFDSLTFGENTLLTINNFLVETAGSVVVQDTTIGDTSPHIIIKDDKLDPSLNPPQIEFKNCSFRPTNVLVEQLHTQRLSVTGGNGLVGFGFSHCLWASIPVPSWLGLGLSFSVSPLDQDLKTPPLPAECDAKRLIYERLKQQAQADGDHQLAGEFYFWQQWYRYYKLPITQPEKWVLWFYYTTSAFGLSVLRPLLCMLLVFIAGAGLYFVLLSCLNPKVYSSIYQAEPLGRVLYLSLKTSVPLLFTNFPNVLKPWPTTWPKLLGCGTFLLASGVQTLLQGYLLFQIGAAIRNKVKR